MAVKFVRENNVGVDIWPDSEEDKATMLVQILWEAVAMMGLKVQGIYRGECLLQGESRKRLTLSWDHNASLTPGKRKREGWLEES